MMLPEPDPAFHWTVEPWGHALRCRPLERVAQHAFTTKQLQLRVATPEAQTAAWTQAAASVGAGLEQLMRIKQVHGGTVRVLKKGHTGPADLAERPEADAQISNAPGLLLCVQVADCVPILLADHTTGAVAAIHAGWRGKSAGIARAAVEAMRREFETDAGDVIAAIGPSIGACCYEVGPNLVDAFRTAGFAEEDTNRWFTRTEAGSLRLDLWAANRDQLVSAGLRADQIFVCGLCTQTHRTIFDSYRAEGDNAGRMAGLIVVP